METARLYTVEELLDMGKADDFELDEGILVPVVPGGSLHSVVCARVARLMGSHVDAHGLRQIRGNDPGFVLRRRPDTLRGPDVAFIDASHVGPEPDNSFYEGAPNLAVEVAATHSADVVRRVSQFLAAGR